MKILVDARVGWGFGIGRYVSNTVPLVAEMMPDVQFDVLVNARDEEVAVTCLAGRPNARVRLSDIIPFSLREQWALPGVAHNYDLIWFTNYWVPLVWRRPCMVVVHDLLHLHQDLFPAGKLHRWLSALTFGKVRRAASGISFVSRFTQREFEGRFGAAKLSCIQHNGMDHSDWEMFDPDHPPAKDRLALIVGAFKRHKNIEVALQAWKAARLSDGWQLKVITPEGPLRSSVDIGLLLEGVEGVELLSGVSNAALRDLYGRAAIVLTPSLYEGFGLPLLEGMQAGALCISATTPASIEVSEGADVVFVPGHDVSGWAKALRSAAARYQDGTWPGSRSQQVGMRRAKEFTWQRVAEHTADLLERISSRS